MRRAGARQNGDVPGVTPFLVNEETLYKVTTQEHIYGKKEK